MEITALPDPVHAHLGGYRVDGGNRNTSSSAEVYCLVHPQKPDLFLKTLVHPLPPVVEAELLAEKTAMDWLQGQLAVPRVLCYHRGPEREYLLVSRIEGVAGHGPESRADAAGTARQFAAGLRQIHTVDPVGCPLDWRLERFFSWAEELIERLPAEARPALRANLAVLKQDRPTSEDLVFVHGDYCLPNILLKDGRLSGFIDWGFAGVGDRYLDFAAAVGTIRRNLGDEWIEPFFAAYGLQPDAERLAYFRRVLDFAG